ncbi:MAG: AarF/ABC1/UbiB kinase family protein [Pseudomonadota bacterium]
MASKDEGVPVPSGRLSRLSRIGGLGAGIAGSVISHGARQMARGEKPDLEKLLLTPSNVKRVTDELSRLRGAAMKVGQLLSMDGGEFIAPEFAEILAKLRSSAYSMPPAQLQRVLNANWGRKWLQQFKSFDVRPIASASIGQVHRAVRRDGREVAIKVQYPGVRDSINSDVDNVASLVRLTQLLPEGVDISPLLNEAKRQLNEEADYLLEAEKIRRFAKLLRSSDEFALPDVHDDITTETVLAMSYMKGRPIDTLADASLDQRNRGADALMRLVMLELFDFKFMQSDPNFANYLVEDNTDKIILLDFGAARDVPDKLSDGYRNVLSKALRGDWPGVRQSLVDMGLSHADADPKHAALFEEMIKLAIEPMRADAPYDFANSDLAMRMRDAGLTLRQSGFTHIPPPVTIFLHRKIGGTYLLATKLRAKVDVAAIVKPHLDI